MSGPPTPWDELIAEGEGLKIMEERMDKVMSGDFAAGEDLRDLAYEILEEVVR